MAVSTSTRPVPSAPTPGRSRSRWWIVVFVAIVATSAAAGAAAVRLAGASVAATVYVRAPLSDASCLYFTCPQAPPGPLGNAYVVGQASILRSPTIAELVA